MQRLLFDAEQLRDTAIAAVEQRAEQEDAWDSDAVADFVLNFLRTNGPSGSEAITYAAKEAGHVPHDDRAFGSVYMRLAKSGQIVKQGLQERRARGHASRGGYVWGVTQQQLL